MDAKVLIQEFVDAGIEPFDEMSAGETLRLARLMGGTSRGTRDDKLVYSFAAPDHAAQFISAVKNQFTIPLQSQIRQDGNLVLIPRRGA